MSKSRCWTCPSCMGTIDIIMILNYNLSLCVLPLIFPHRSRFPNRPLLLISKIVCPFLGVFTSVRCAIQTVATYSHRSLSVQDILTSFHVDNLSVDLNLLFTVWGYMMLYSNIPYHKKGVTTSLRFQSVLST